MIAKPPQTQPRKIMKTMGGERWYFDDDDDMNVIMGKQ